jgi:hypothetical protein
MSRLRFKIAMSLDGYVAGPDQSIAHPLGLGGLRLHEWLFPLEVFRRLHGAAGGARTAQQYLSAGLVDEMEISLVPVLLGGGERLFEGLGDDLHGLREVRVVAAPGVTHLKFVRE